MIGSKTRIIGNCYIFRMGNFRILSSGTSNISTDVIMNYTLSKGDRPSVSTLFPCIVYKGSMQTDGYIAAAVDGSLSLYYYENGSPVKVTDENKEQVSFFFSVTWSVL